MRKIFLTISICLLFLSGCSTSNYPKNYPTMTIEYNGEYFETEVNEVTWSEIDSTGQGLGNSLISAPELEIAEDMDYINVQPNDVINFKIEYDKNISEIYAIEVDGLGADRKEIKIDIDNNSIKVPNEKGEYVYSVKVIWDSTPESTHFVSYVIKLNVI
ncbi:hypothetical protein [Clostridium nigeriense]|uniref:hypothetical protein n=1 Tax=Clostridium nigeriense TaxID=1805470 RepID=UPI003D34F830